MGREHVGQVAVSEEAEKLAFALRGTLEVVITEDELLNSGAQRPRHIASRLRAAGIPAYVDGTMSVRVEHGRLDVSRRRTRKDFTDLDQVYVWLI
jgi:hypothetical protein